MKDRSRPVISRRVVDGLRGSGRDTIVWDSELPGFGVRVYPSGRKVYVVQSRSGGAPRRVTLGVHGELTAERARKRAASVIQRIKAGEDAGAGPGADETTVADLAERYMRVHVAAHCNAHTARIYRGSLDNHILPAIGGMPFRTVERSHVAALHHRLRHTPRAANRALMILSKMFSLAAAWGLAPETGNPCRSVRKYREGRRERFLTREEYRRLGAALAEAETDGSARAPAVAALRLLMLTGCRLNEILTLRWDDVDRAARQFRLRDGKTGARMVPLTPTAEAVLAGIARVPGNPWVIVGKKPAGRLTSLTADWYRLRARAGLDDVRIHDLRHSYASRALALGESLPMIARLLGHARIRTTARYAHLARDAIGEAAARVAAGIGEDILPPGPPGRGLPPPEPGAEAVERASLMAAAARTAARIGEDILPRPAAPGGTSGPAGTAVAAATDSA